MDSAGKISSRVAGRVLVATAVATVVASAPLAHAGPNGTGRCTELSRLKSVFPSAKSIGFRVRRQIRSQGARAPIWPGRCGAFWTTYEGNGAPTDVTVTLYATAHNVLAALAEPLYGAVQVLPNGARVRTSGPAPVNVNGAPGSSTGVVSAFRNLFISSGSIDVSTSADPTATPVPIAVQLHIHRRMYAAARSLG
jgi:hypothetical protein